MAHAALELQVQSKRPVFSAPLRACCLRGLLPPVHSLCSLLAPSVEMLPLPTLPPPAGAGITIWRIQLPCLHVTCCGMMDQLDEGGEAFLLDARRLACLACMCAVR